MPSTIILAVLLGSAAPMAPMSLAALERGIPIQVDCNAKRKTPTVPTRAKREQQGRKRCQVIAPILM